MAHLASLNMPRDFTAWPTSAGAVVMAAVRLATMSSANTNESNNSLNLTSLPPVASLPLNVCGIGPPSWREAVALRSQETDLPPAPPLPNGSAPRKHEDRPRGPVSPVAPRRTAVAAVVRPADHSLPYCCLLYTSDAADDLLCVDLGGRRII